MKAVVAAFNQEKALIVAFSVITNFQLQYVLCTGRAPECCSLALVSASLLPRLVCLGVPCGRGSARCRSPPPRSRVSVLRW